MSEVTSKQQAFINAYLTNGFNAAQAAIKAGYSAHTANSQASRLLKHEAVSAEIQQYFIDQGFTVNEVLARLSAHARGDIGDIWDEKTGMLNWSKARTLGKTALIKRMRHKTSRVTRGVGGNIEEIETFEDEIELHDPQRALQMIGKQLGMFVEKAEIEHQGLFYVKAYKGISPDDWDSIPAPASLSIDE